MHGHLHDGGGHHHWQGEEALVGSGDTVTQVGAPMAGMEIKMVNWEEGNYRISDSPRPR